jgi:phage terminase large subunit-like protein
MSFVKTPDQVLAVRLLTGEPTHVLLYGGSRSGKTFIIVRQLVIRSLMSPKSRHCILRKHFTDLNKAIVCDTFPKVMEVCFPGVGYGLNKSLFFAHFGNGSEIWFGGLDKGDKILGNEYATMYFNEISELAYEQVETAYSRNAMKCEGLRNRFYYDQNPPGKSHWSYRLFEEKQNPKDNTPLVGPGRYASMRMNPGGNLANLSEDYMLTLQSLSRRKRQRFLEGVYQDDNENALWKRESMINPYRIKAAPANLERIVIGVDPAVTKKDSSDHTGIVIAGCKRLQGQMHYYVLDDRSLIGSPREWAATAINAYDEYQADRIVAEVNQGGDMVEQTIRNVDRRVSYKGVRATRGKIVRAEPIAELYERGLVHHVGELQLLEDEMCDYCGFDGEKSPDRMDALVWALTELSRGGLGSRPITAA